ncbi:MAG: DUF423 domain-containing protein [Pirellulaceae bacterium]
MNAKTCLVLGSILGGLAVALGAFGAHGLQTALGAWIADEALRAKRLDDWDVAARYQMYHALALLAVGFVAARGRDWSSSLAGICFVLGPLIFSGCLYALVLSHAVSAEGWKWLGAIVPLGGVLMILGWGLLAAAAWRMNSNFSAPKPLK